MVSEKKNTIKDVIKMFLFYFCNSLVTDGKARFEMWMFLLEILKDDNQLNYKALNKRLD